MIEKTFIPGDVEAKHYRVWEQSGAFHAKPEGNLKPHVIMMPPPNVTGALHMGHALTMTLQDILTRYQRMKGCDALWLPGTDHAGISTQIVVERQLAAKGQSRSDFSRSEFIDKVWEWKAESGGQIFNQLRRLGATCDWSRERFTMDEGLSKAVRKVFVRLYKEGLIYKAKRLVNWDPKMHTALSDLEVHSKDVKGHMWHIRYPIEGQQERFITIATTRPETMLGDVAIIVHPDDERYKELIGKFAVLPIVGRLLPIIADDYVDPEFATGAMKVTPGHDFNDFAIGQRHKLPLISIFDKNACMNENAPAEYRGLDRFEARKKLLAELEAQELLLKTDDISHSVPYDEKTKSIVLEPLLTDQWFADAATLAKPAIEAVEAGQTQFVPKHWENTFFEWMRNIQPWCISRQIWWGHQIPAWYGPDGTIFVEETEAEAQLAANKHYGEKTRINQDTDVLDTWFSSALWPFSTLGWPDETPDLKKYYPGEVLVTGFDIIFFWVCRMMMMGIHFMGDVPFKKVYIHALVRDATGQKMSKTKGNVIDPLEVIDDYGADALRMTLTALAAQGRDIKLSVDRVEGYRNFATKIWNASRYARMNECVSDLRFSPLDAEGTINKWIIGAIVDLEKTVSNAIESYKFNEAAMALYQFIWGNFCDWYLEFTKPILQNADVEAALKDETRKTTAWVLEQLYIMLNPIMPFITEELYQSIGNRQAGDRLVSANWPVYSQDMRDIDAMSEINWLIKVISEIRSVRADMNVPASAKINLLVKDARLETFGCFSTHEEIIKRMAGIANIDAISIPPKGAVLTVVDEATLILPIADIIDLTKEGARLRKEIEKLTSDIFKINQKLENKEFIANAPEEIISEQKSRRAEADAVRTKLSNALRQLEAA